MNFLSHLDLDIIVTYLNAKNEVNRSIGSKSYNKERHRDKDFSSVMTLTFTL